MSFILETNELDLKYYIVPSIRKPCSYNNCNDYHCYTHGNTCKFLMVKEYCIDFVNMLVEECIISKIKFMELMRIDNHSVNYVLNYNSYTYRPYNSIVYEGNIKPFDNLKQEFNIFHINKNTVFNIKYDLIVDNEYYKQRVKDNEPIIRAFMHSYYWINNPQNSIYNRNLGYENEIQDILSAILEFNISEYIKN